MVARAQRVVARVQKGQDSLFLVVMQKKPAKWQAKGSEHEQYTEYAGLKALEKYHAKKFYLIGDC